jgi:hypothetical protein
MKGDIHVHFYLYAYINCRRQKTDGPPQTAVSEWTDTYFLSNYLEVIGIWIMVNICMCIVSDIYEYREITYIHCLIYVYMIELKLMLSFTLFCAGDSMLLSILYTYTHTYTHTCIYIYIYLYTYFVLCGWQYASVHIVYIHTYIHIYIQTYIYEYVYIYIHICIYTYFVLCGWQDASVHIVMAGAGMDPPGHRATGPGDAPSR